MLKICKEQTLRSTEFLDSNATAVQKYARRIIGSSRDPKEQAIKLFYAVRDRIRYDVYGVDLSRAGMKASAIIGNGVGFCIHKSIVFAAAARYLGIPSRLAFTDVRNHISTAKLRAIIGGDVFHYHAYVEIFLDGRWIKVTPVFNRQLCYIFGVEPLDFDGIDDATLQPYDTQGKHHLEFIRHHGIFEDFPYEQCLTTLKRHHPRLFTEGRQTIRGNLTQEQNNEAIV